MIYFIAGLIIFAIVLISTRNWLVSFMTGCLSTALVFMLSMAIVRSCDSYLLKAKDYEYFNIEASDIYYIDDNGISMATEDATIYVTYINKDGIKDTIHLTYNSRDIFTIHYNVKGESPRISIRTYHKINDTFITKGLIHMHYTVYEIYLPSADCVTLV